MGSAKHVFVSYARFDGTALAVRIQEALVSPVVVPTFPVGKIPVLINNLTWLPLWRPDRPQDLDFDYGFIRLLERVTLGAGAGRPESG